MLFTYEVIYSSRKSLAIQVDSDCNIVVRAPYGVSQKSIDEFVLDKKKWLEKTVTSQLEKKKRRKIYTTEEIELLRKKAKEILPQKVEYYADIMGVKPKSVKINSAQKRYGSCSSENNINFSLYLMDKDEKFIDYVVIHELAHIKHHNHSKAFSSFVAYFMPDYKEISKIYR
jgi:predicted metal-dependent hydrolase